MSTPLITGQMPESASKDWQLSPEDGPKPACFTVQLRRTAHVFPWFRFVFADGDDGRVVFTFVSHVITIEGHGLSGLLWAAAVQRLARIILPSENDAKFGVRVLARMAATTARPLPALKSSRTVRMRTNLSAWDLVTGVFIGQTTYAQSMFGMCSGTVQGSFEMCAEYLQKYLFCGRPRTLAEG